MPGSTITVHLEMQKAGDRVPNEGCAPCASVQVGGMASPMNQFAKMPHYVSPWLAPMPGKPAIGISAGLVVFLAVPLAERRRPPNAKPAGTNWRYVPAREKNLRTSRQVRFCIAGARACAGKCERNGLCQRW